MNKGVGVFKEKIIFFVLFYFFCTFAILFFTNKIRIIKWDV
jgi:hypothetical protein